MLKKALYSTLGVLCVGALLLGIPLIYYARTAYNTVRDAVKESVPIKIEIERARQMIEELKPEIASNLRVIAQQEVEVGRLTSEVESKQNQLVTARDQILRLKADLVDGDGRFVYAGKNYTSAEVKQDLGHRFEQFKIQESVTDKLQKILSARQRSLDAARTKLNEMLATKKHLEIEVEDLEARHTMLEVAQAENNISMDDSALSRTRQVLDDIRTRIDVAERLVTSEAALGGAIQLDEKNHIDLIENITDYFGEGREEVEALVKTK
jgi:chromosome segregation ATPase